MRYDAAKQAVILSVGELSFFCCRRGDLESFRPQKPIDPELSERLLENLLGQTVSREERSFAKKFEYDGLDLIVEATAAWVRAGSNPALYALRVGKGKATLWDETELLCTAFLFADSIGAKALEVGFAVNSDEGLDLSQKTYSFESLALKFSESLNAALPFATFCEERATVRIPSAKTAKFPFSSLREGQELLVRECYRDFKAGKLLFAEAPTGIGKTASTLYPAVRALGEGVADRIFYLTAKAAPRHEAYLAAGKLFEAGAHLRTMVMSAKEELCQNEAAKADPGRLSFYCNSADCPYAKGFYDRCDKAIFSLLAEGNGFPRNTILEKAKEYGICPYEFQLELLAFCDIVICDYNYVFDPFVYLRRCFAGEGDGKKNLFLVDEAHNLASRASDMYSAGLSLTALLSCLSLLEPGTALYEALYRLTEQLKGIRELCRETLQKDETGVERGFDLSSSSQPELFEAAANASEELERYLLRMHGKPCEPIFFKTSKDLRRFSTIAEGYDKSYVTFLEVDGEERKIRLLCLDPSDRLSECLKNCVGGVLFSATLTPLDYFADLLGGKKRGVILSLPSPFPRENLCIAILPGVSTRYADREKSYGKISSILAAAVSGKPGNYIAYFPSYAYLEEVRKRFAKKYPKVELVVQSRGMGQAEKEAFLSAFADDGKLRVGFCVLGGSFSEGVDLPGGRLIGTVVVGTGLPGISNERNILMEYYEKTRERGFDYAYVYPGMNRVLQAAGRVIRTETDRGILVLVDDRYTDPRQKLLFPEHWEDQKLAGNAAELAEIVSDFWNSN
ncbi:MAG: ATP-dependent DNA helicase [Clostridia bacterium]|nr:ATP-dependent DNA helicase [Clostridia bacterium]